MGFDLCRFCRLTSTHIESVLAGTNIWLKKLNSCSRVMKIIVFFLFDFVVGSDLFGCKVLKFLQIQWHDVARVCCDSASNQICECYIFICINFLLLDRRIAKLSSQQHNKPPICKKKSSKIFWFIASFTCSNGLFKE